MSITTLLESNILRKLYNSLFSSDIKESNMAAHMAWVRLQAKDWGVWQVVVILGHCCPTMLTINKLAMYSTRSGSQGMYITFTSTTWIRQNPLWFWDTEEKSPKNQNRGTSAPKIGHVNVSAKKTFKKVTSFAKMLCGPFVEISWRLMQTQN